MSRLFARLQKLRDRRGRALAATIVAEKLASLVRQPALFVRRLIDWSRFKRRVREYRLIDETELQRSRVSDTVFIFGSGSSLNALTESERREFERHNTLGFNWFPRERFVRCDYHLIREIESRGDTRSFRIQLEEYFTLLRANPLFHDAILLIQTGWRALNGNQAIGLGLVPRGHRVFLWRTIIGRTEPSHCLSDGLTHAQGTLCECVNVAFLLGWKTIVLVGVDLYDRRHFWLTPEEASSPGWNVPHGTAENGIVQLMGKWRGYLKARGVDLFVYNPASLLAQAVPVWPGLPRASDQRHFSHT